jgi:tetratricopeptide (TPR) repeat protein
MRFFLPILIFLFFPLYCPAETILLKSGNKIEGKILEKTDQYIKVDFNGSLIYYELKYVAAIEEDKPPAATSSDLFLEDSSLNFKKGLKYASEAKFKEAKEEFKKGLAIKPSDHNLSELLKVIEGLESGTIKEEYAVYLFKGTNYLVDSQYQQAITEFLEALKLKPGDSDLYYYLGICNYKLEQYQQALDNFIKVSAIGADDEIYYYLGICYYSLSQYQQAITNLEKATEIDPFDAEAYSLIGTSNYFLGKIELAQTNLLKAKELFQKKGDYLNSKDIEEFLGKLK